ncbi:MAG: hypothetical protein IKK24_01020, partial [Clostridia bacterium]|nr:hypothetical protein [Clostridia bacterium]
VIWDENNIKLEVDWINETKYEVTYGNPYAIELEREGEWISRQKIDNLGFTLPAYALKSGKTEEKEYNLTDSFDITENGKYRLVTDCSVYNKGKDGKATKCNLWAEFTVTHKGDAVVTAAKTFINFEAQYIRTGSLTDITNYPLFTVLQSTDELNAYYESNKDNFNLERRKNPAADSTIGFLDACDKYKADFFKKNALVLIVIEEGSGSTRHNVNNIRVDTDGKFYVDVSSIVPEVGTCDMAQWHIIIEIAKEYCPKTSDGISIYMDNKLITDEEWHTHQPVENEQTVSEPVTGYCGNTQTTIYFEDNKSYTFMSGNSVTMTDILVNLDYDKNKLCKCLPEYKVDTEFGTGYGINITSGYARCDKGQADLTKEQIDKLKQIILWAKDKAGVKSKKSSFEFSITWNTYGMSSYDSKTGTLIKTKDATNPKDYITNLKLTEQQYNKIWKLIKGLDIESYPDKYNPHKNGVSTPYMTLILSVKSDDIDKTVTVEETMLSYDANNKKGQKFLDVCKGIEEILTETNEWKSLPEYEFFYD